MAAVVVEVSSVQAKVVSNRYFPIGIRFITI